MVKKKKEWITAGGELRQGTNDDPKFRCTAPALYATPYPTKGSPQLSTDASVASTDEQPLPCVLYELNECK